MNTLYKNGKIFTSDENNLYADTFFVKDGRIMAVGTENDVMQAVAEVCEDSFDIVDLEKKRVIPGLIDSHMHVMILADYSKQISCLPPLINSIEDLKKAVKKVRESMPKSGWILGWGYDEGKLAEHRAPNKNDLDEVAADVPVFIMRTCVHIASVNSKALELAGIDRNTADPIGGHIEKDENGEPTGVLLETAKELVLDVIPKPTTEEKICDVLDLGQLLLSQGIVAVADMGGFDDVDAYEFFNAAAARGLKQEVALYYIWNLVRNVGNYTMSDESKASGRQIRTAGLKLVSDGSVSGHTAFVDEPYMGTKDCGMFDLNDEIIDSAIEFCKDKKCQLSVHAMGGKAIARIIDKVCEEENWLNGNGTESCVPHVRMEHITEPREESIEKAVENNVAFVTQPIFQYCEIESYLKNLGLERTQKTYPIRHMLDRGVKIALSTDAPATSWAIPSDPWSNIKAAVTRTAYDGTDCGQKERIGLEEAIIMYTKIGAEVCGFKDIGQIKKGCKANFAVLDKDVFDLQSEEIDTVKVLETFISGEKVFEMK